MNTRGACRYTPVIVVLLAACRAFAQAPAPSPGDQVTFKAESNLVLVPVVVRDSHGNAVGNLSKQDFQLLDNGKAVEIAQFGVEETSGHVAVDRKLGGPAKAAVVAIPEHFAALMFDDAHLSNFDDITYARRAALKYLDNMQPSDRVAMFTASGQYDVDFTTDRDKLRTSLMKLAPGLPAFYFGMTAEEVARLVIVQCARIVRRMSVLPGQRTLVFISPGLPILGPDWSCVRETMRLVDTAVRSRVVMDGLDTQGLGLLVPTKRAWEFQLRLAEGTGGQFIRDTNDLDGAVQQLAAAPRYMYLLGFTPQTGMTGSGFHKLEVKLTAGHKLEVQARNGYWAGAGPEPVSAGSEAVAAAKTGTPHYSAAETREVAAALGVSNPPAAAPVKTAAPKNDEIVTSNQAVTFRVQSNLVEVPVIVRDRSGNAVGNLRQEDFRILDKGKRQEIAKFDVQKAGHGSPAAEGAPPAAGGSPANAQAGAAAMPNRFIAFLFDDLHTRFEDLPQVRNAMVKYINNSLGAQDRAALYTTSGRHGADFTADREKLSDQLMKITPSPIRGPELNGCGAYVSYFQAVQVDQQVGLNPIATDVAKCQALRLAVEEYGDFDRAVMEIRDAFTSGLQESRAVLADLKTIVQRMAGMPGQRTVILVSPGFFVPPDLQRGSSDLMALAIRSKVLIDSVDARGVWTPSPFDACQKGGAATTIQDEISFRQIDNEAATDELIALAEGTGGTTNFTNDFEAGIRKAATAPEYLYVLGFVPSDMKLDGSFHALKVSLGGSQKVTLQARKGYWAPKHAEDEVQVARQEIESAVFSRDEIHNLPVEMHTRVTKAGEQSKLDVLTSVDLKGIHLRKADDRSRNDLTIVAALFDPNGNFIAGTEKLLQLRLLDETVSRLQERPPVVIDTDFDLKPGGYLVRLVVRDAEGQQITAENAAVEVR